MSDFVCFNLQNYLFFQHLQTNGKKLTKNPLKTD